MDTAATIAVFTPLMPIMVSLLKSLFPDTNPRYFSVGISASVAVILGITLLIVGKESYEDIIATVSFVGTFIFGVGTALHKVQK